MFLAGSLGAGFPLGGVGDAPIALNFSPPVANTVGFLQPIEFDVLDVNLGPGGQLASVLVFADFGFWDEEVHNHAAFSPDYAFASTRTPILGGWHYSILRNSPGWLGSVTLHIFATDVDGQLLTPEAYYWPTPTPYQLFLKEAEARGNKSLSETDRSTVAHMVRGHSRAGRG